MIKAYRGTSLVDYPGKVAFTIFTGGCNLRCPYCYNVDLVLPERLASLPDIPEDLIFNELLKRRGFVEGVAITGGEPFIHGPKLRELVRVLKKKLSLPIKIDTNGTFPEELASLLEDVDYIAVDVKTTPENYGRLKGNWAPVEKTLKLLRDAKADYEVRITAVPDLVDSEVVSVLGKILKSLGVKKVALQKFIGNKGTLDPIYETIHPYTKEELNSFASILRKHIPEVVVR